MYAPADFNFWRMYHAMVLYRVSASRGCVASQRFLGDGYKAGHCFAQSDQRAAL